MPKFMVVENSVFFCLFCMEKINYLFNFWYNLEDKDENYKVSPNSKEKFKFLNSKIRVDCSSNF